MMQAGEIKVTVHQINPQKVRQSDVLIVTTDRPYDVTTSCIVASNIRQVFPGNDLVLLFSCRNVSIYRGPRRFAGLRRGAAWLARRLRIRRRETGE
jgi:hypothetical protein